MALTTTELAEFARRSRDLMNDGGEHWMKGEYQDYDEYDVLRYCSIGAVRKALFEDVDDVNIDDPRYRRVVAALAEAVREELKAQRYRPINAAIQFRVLTTAPSTGHAESVVIDFNDNPDTQWADVERVFRRAEQTLAQAA